MGCRKKICICAKRVRGKEVYNAGTNAWQNAEGEENRKSGKDL